MRFLGEEKTYPMLRIVGYVLLVSYLIITRDFGFSIAWVFTFFAIAVSVTTPIVLILPRIFPRLERHHFADKVPNPAAPLTHEEWQKQYDEWVQKKKSTTYPGFESGIS